LSISTCNGSASVRTALMLLDAEVAKDDETRQD
jgi:hypothetical protein